MLVTSLLIMHILQFQGVLSVIHRLRCYLMSAKIQLKAIMVSDIPSGLFYQLLAGSTGSLSMLACAAVFAWVTPMLPRLMHPDSDVPMTPEEASWMVSMPEFGNLVSPLPAGIIADRCGRKVVILASSPIFFIGWAIILYFKTLIALNIARIIQGLAIGMVYTVLPLYLGEISSPKYRGAISSIFYSLWWFGFLFEYILGPIMSFVNFTYVSALSNVIFFVTFMSQPESPYYYLMKNDIENAHKSLSWLRRTTNEDIIKELTRMQQSVQGDMKNKLKCYEILSKPADRKAVVILFLVGFLRQFCGLIPLSVYSTQTLSDSAVDFIVSPDNVTIVMGILMFLGSLCSLVTLDRFGRKTMLYFSCSLSGISMFSAGTFFLLKSHGYVDISLYCWVPPVSLMVLSAVSVVGIFPINIAYSSELFTSNTRGTVSGIFSIYTTCIGVCILKCYLTIFNVVGVFLNFYIYAIVCFIGVILTYFVFPETKGKPFEQIRLELDGNNPM